MHLGLVERLYQKFESAKTKVPKHYYVSGPVLNNNLKLSTGEIFQESCRE